MKLRKILLMFMLVLVVMAVLVMPAAADAPKSNFSGYLTEFAGTPPLPGENADWFNGNEFKWFIVEDAWSIYEVDDDRLDGIDVEHLTIIVDTRTWQATLWGTIEVFAYDGAALGARNWAGHVAGKGHLVADGFYFLYNATLHGVGASEGLVAHVQYEGVSNDATNTFDMTGYIVETGAAQ